MRSHRPVFPPPRQFRDWSPKFAYARGGIPSPSSEPRIRRVSALIAGWLSRMRAWHWSRWAAGAPVAGLHQGAHRLVGVRGQLEAWRE
jgi:hypothetical protein